MSRHKWGGPRSRSSQLRGLQTRYENGNLSATSLARAYRMYADDLEASIADKLLPYQLEKGWIRAWRKRADALEKEAAPNSR